MVYGDYPPVMRKNVGSRLPSFTDEEAKRVKGSFDFVGFNHYFAIYVKADLSRLDEKVRDYMADAAVAYDSKNLRALLLAIMLQNTIGTTDDDLVHFAVPFLKSKNQFSFGLGLAADFMTSTPWALKKMLKHLQVKYKNPAVMIHENGNLPLMIP
jgi:beta-glucosidase